MSRDCHQPEPEPGKEPPAVPDVLELRNPRGGYGNIRQNPEGIWDEVHLMAILSSLLWIIYDGDIDSCHTMRFRWLPGRSSSGRSTVALLTYQRIVDHQAPKSQTSNLGPIVYYHLMYGRLADIHTYISGKGRGI